MDETIRGESNLGQRLGKLPKSESNFLVFHALKRPYATSPTKETIGYAYRMKRHGRLQIIKTAAP